MSKTKQKVTITKTTKKYVRQTGGDTGYKVCGTCYGTGRVKKK